MLYEQPFPTPQRALCITGRWPGASAGEPWPDTAQREQAERLLDEVRALGEKLDA